MQTFHLNRTWIGFFAALSFAAVLSGCTTYYKVKDVATDKTYYTTQIDRQSSGSIRFMDENSGNKVTLQNSEVIEINEEMFKANTKKK
jgi:hypothetical protein